MLDKIIESLECDELILEDTKNQFGETVTLKSLSINQEGQFELYEVLCYNSSLHGLGTCSCNSHQSYRKFKIPALEGLEIIMEYIKKKKEK
ncbi:MAG: hypothetical protein ACOCP8_08120, partial [archaeon]